MAEVKGIRSFKKPVNQKVSVVHLVVERIKQALLKKELKPGDYLPSETELTKSLGISKSSVREAIKMLQAMGIVEVRRGQGTIISKQPGPDYINTLLFQLIVEDSDPRHIVDLRTMFETACTLMAMAHATEDDIAQIKETITGLEKTINNGLPSIEKDFEFHLAILNSTHNPLVIMLGDMVFELFKQSISKSMLKSPGKALRDHKRILNAFLKKDEEKLRNEIVRSLRRWVQVIGSQKQG